jgi:hypothetical protein
VEVERFLNAHLYGPGSTRRKRRPPDQFINAAIRMYFRTRCTLGVGFTGWNPEIEQPGLGWCPVCGGEVEDPTAVCLACSRSGLDGWLPFPLVREKPRAYTPGSRKGGLDGHYVRGRRRQA